MYNCDYIILKTQNKVLLYIYDIISIQMKKMALLIYSIELTFTVYDFPK